MSEEENSELNETLAVSEEDDFAETTFDQSADSLFHHGSGSSLYIPNESVKLTPRKRKQQKPTLPRRIQDSGAKLKCNLCGRALKTQKGLDKHCLNHKLEEAASRKPSPEQLQVQCINDAIKICIDVANAPCSTVISGGEFKDFAVKITACANPEPSNEFCDFVKVCVQPILNSICQSKSVSPNSIRSVVRYHLHSSLAETEIRDLRLSKLLNVLNSEPPSPGIAEQFLQEFCRRLVHSTVTFILSLMREAIDDPQIMVSTKYSQDDFDTLFSKQSLHNILGCTVKGILRRSRQYSGNKKWSDIQKVVLNRFAHIGVMEAQPQETSFWTALLGRKSYTFVTESLLDFFVEIAKVFCFVETKAGSLPAQEVLERVNSSPSLLSQWCALVGSGLSEKDSFFLMRLLVLSLLRTFGRGIVYRRSNLEAERRMKSSGGVTSVSKRAQLAR